MQFPYLLKSHRGVQADGWRIVAVDVEADPETIEEAIVAPERTEPLPPPEEHVPADPSE